MVHQQLGEDWRECLDDFEIRLEEGDATVLQGPVVDQFALHGIISRIRDLNLEL